MPVRRKRLLQQGLSTVTGTNCGLEKSGLSRQSHKLESAGSNPAPATNFSAYSLLAKAPLFQSGQVGSIPAACSSFSESQLVCRVGGKRRRGQPLHGMTATNYRAVGESRDSEAVAALYFRARCCVQTRPCVHWGFRPPCPAPGRVRFVEGVRLVEDTVSKTATPLKRRGFESLTFRHFTCPLPTHYPTTAASVVVYSCHCPRRHSSDGGKASWLLPSDTFTASASNHPSWCQARMQRASVPLVKTLSPRSCDSLYTVPWPRVTSPWQLDPHLPDKGVRALKQQSTSGAESNTPPTASATSLKQAIS